MEDLKVMDLEPTPLPEDLAAKMRSGEIPFVVAIDNQNQFKLLYVEGNAPTEPSCEVKEELLKQVQLGIWSCGCVNHRLKRYVTLGGTAHCMYTNIPC